MRIKSMYANQTQHVYSLLERIQNKARRHFLIAMSQRSSSNRSAQALRPYQHIPSEVVALCPPLLQPRRIQDVVRWL